MTRLFEYARYAAAIFLALIGLRMLLHLVPALVSGEHHSSVETFLLVQTFSLPCSLLAAAYLLVFRRWRMVAITALLLSSLSWLPAVLRHIR
ncbi:MAG: hypothetical protein K1X78_27320 [Verrucomicrobiaceae bacterium]|nr:hypothetical protein [Verrucomicrobiaceae bacterium]